MEEMISIHILQDILLIYENTSANELNFTLISPLVMSDYGNNNLNIYISPVDIPAITDVDNVLGPRYLNLLNIRRICGIS